MKISLVHADLLNVYGALQISDSQYFEVKLDTDVSSSFGTVQIIGTVNGSICDNDWDDSDAKVVCGTTGRP